MPVGFGVLGNLLPPVPTDVDGLPGVGAEGGAAPRLADAADDAQIHEGKEREDLLDDFARQLGRRQRWQLGRRQRWQPGRRRREVEGDV